jgi:hypothetical protein
MYGIVNKSMEELVGELFGKETWDKVLIRSGVETTFFISNEPYDDAITFKLAVAISEETALPLDKVLFAFGEWWILKTTLQKYGGLMSTGGKTLGDFLKNLPEFHNHIMLLYPKMTPPEFQVSDEEATSIHIHYFSKRQGLKDFVHGLLSGIAKLFKTEAEITLLEDRDSGNDHEVFKVSWA